MEISVLVLEDEEYTRKYLVKLVEQHPGVGEVWGVGSGVEAVDIAVSHQPTLALLDVELGRKERYNGIQVAEEISRMSPGTRYVFITGYAKYALDSFVVHPYDYLLKPVDRTRLQNTLDAVTGLAKAQPPLVPAQLPAISMRTKGGTDLVAIADIIFIEIVNRQTKVHTLTTCYTSYHPLQYFINLLPATIFLQLHKSFLVNKNKISSIREVGYRSYELNFKDTTKTALMSRQQYMAHRHLLGLKVSPYPQ